MKRCVLFAFSNQLFHVVLKVSRAHSGKMNAFTTRTSWSVAVVWCLLSGVQAAEPPNPVLADDAKARWTLSTDDTSLTISVSGNKLYIDALENPSQDWNWVPVASEVPLPGQNSIRTVEAGVNTGNIDQTPNWTYVGASEDKSDGNSVTLRFTSTTPALELKSVWSARPGPGPVENQVTVENKSGRQVVYSP